ARQHDACLGQHLGYSLVQRGVFHHGLLMRSGCPLLMAGSQPAQILEAVPASESEKEIKYARCQPGRETGNAFASDKESKAETEHSGLVEGSFDEYGKSHWNRP